MWGRPGARPIGPRLAARLGARLPPPFFPEAGVGVALGGRHTRPDPPTGETGPDPETAERH